MTYKPETVAFLRYLKSNPLLRKQICAAEHKTLVYAGDFVKPMWREIEQLKRTNPDVMDKETLPDVLARVRAPGTSFNNLLEYLRDVEGKVPWKPDGFTLWRAVSGIFAGNATGRVSFQIGSGVKLDEKVFAATEIRALARNPRVDSVTKDLLAYYERCVANKQSDINVGFISA